MSRNDFIAQTVKTYANMVFRIAFLYTGNKADAEDIMQDVFFKLLSQPPIHDEKHLSSWLTKVTINQSRDHLRKNKKRICCQLNDDLPDFNKKDQLLLADINRLPATDRNIIYLYYFEGYSAKEIAEILQIKENAVFIKLSRARKKLKRILEGN